MHEGHLPCIKCAVYVLCYLRRSTLDHRNLDNDQDREASENVARWRCSRGVPSLSVACTHFAIETNARSKNRIDSALRSDLIGVSAFDTTQEGSK